ncbi:hypothetical protein Cgig2_025203 [Carnegiea gigantea]|uniref:J domain-containing protein n=1 Tax=Carnegiea gigantea TaxID=171969 RepID=A0A9Q1KRD0_9CARY|nr:hypothetical protein Cgig2_025203 [Carnegiea gigantea]
MAGGGERKCGDFYSVLGLEKECTPTELRNAYKKLAMRWHPDRCSASGNSKSVEEAKKKFQDIQEAYSVLSDETKRLLYDVGVYDKDDDENNNESGEESFEQLQDLFNDMFPNSIYQSSTSASQGSTSTPSCSSSNVGSSGTSFINNSCKRSSSEMNNPEGSSSVFDAYLQNILEGEGMHHIHSWKTFVFWQIKVGEIPATGGEHEEEPEEEEIVFLGATAAAAAVEEDRAGNRRFHLGMMSPPTSIPVFPLDLGAAKIPSFSTIHYY